MAWEYTHCQNGECKHYWEDNCTRSFDKKMSALTSKMDFKRQEAYSDMLEDKRNALCNNVYELEKSNKLLSDKILKMSVEVENLSDLNRELVGSLKKIANPFLCLKEQADRNNETVDLSEAYLLASDSGWLNDIAREALARVKEGYNE